MKRWAFWIGHCLPLSAKGKNRFKMANKVFRLGIVVTLALVMLLGVGQLAFSFTTMGLLSEIDSGGLPLSLDDISDIPDSVIEDANRLALTLFEDSGKECSEFTRQLLALYSEARERDFIMFFNPGGWGENLVEDSPSWQSISSGIESVLGDSGYTSLVLSYQRTLETGRGRINEVAEMLSGYSTKAEYLASKVDFLTVHIPDLKVIVAGESNGTIICDAVMDILAENLRVCSIQTGPPFWHKETTPYRTLVVADNGIVPDSFSRGDFFTMIRANLKIIFSSPSPDDEPGEILRYVKAPGHDYRWQYTVVSSSITRFLKENIEVEW